jgi:cytochrome c-type biogenesis protein CcmF
MYRVAGVWGGHEGSLLLWAMMLCVWMLAVATFSKHLPLEMVARILSVMGLVTVGFLLFTLLTSNPFDRLFPVPADGRDLNPLLQDPGMVIHPPMLYMGYVGFSVAFAFAIAALIGGKLDAEWSRWTRPWTVVAWMFLTIGIALGSWWAYYELGWGGWWFWDPVENASFMPWLVGTALIHSLAVTEKRGAFKSWTVLLAITAFSLSLLGTFLVRSGVLSSVHAFATDPARGLFILGFLVVVVGASLTLYAWRAPSVGLGSRFGLFSRESLLLSNNVMLAAAMGAVLLGTLYPLLLDALGMRQDLGRPALLRHRVRAHHGAAGLHDGGGPAGPLEAGFAARPGTPPASGRWVWPWWRRWSAAGWPAASRRWPRWAWPWAGGSWPASPPTCGAASARASGLGMAQRARRLPRAVVGMMLAHLGVAVFIFGVTMVNTYQVERDVKMLPGDKTNVSAATTSPSRARVKCRAPTTCRHARPDGSHP